MKLRMKSYSLETTLTFGKYKGKTVKQIAVSYTHLDVYKRQRNIIPSL